MENRLANSAAKLVVDMNNAVIGVTKLGPVLDLQPDLAAMMTAESAALELSHRHFLDSKVQLKERRKELAAAVKAGRRFATLLRDMRKHALGGKGSREWEALGFRGTRQVPVKYDRLLGLLGTMVGHLELHPEVGCAGLQITAADGEVLHTGLVDARAAVGRAKGDVIRAFQERAKLVKNARRRLRALINALAFAMEGDDGRWFEFGFNRPGVKTTPAKPEGVSVTPLAPNTLSVNWPAVPLAEHYRVWVRVVGVDAEMVVVGKTSLLSFVMQNVPEGDLEIGVSAMNPRGESPVSEVVVVRVGERVPSSE